MDIFTMYYLEEKLLQILTGDEIIKGGKCNDVEDWREKKKTTTKKLDEQKYKRNHIVVFNIISKQFCCKKQTGKTNQCEISASVKKWFILSFPQNIFR